MVSKRLRRPLALSKEGEGIFEPKPNSSSLVYAGMGGGKTTCVAVPTILSQIADYGQAILYNDIKGGEITHQIAELCIKYGRKLVVIDDFGEMGPDYPYRVRINPFSSIQSVLKSNPDHLPLVIESVVHGLIEEPPNEHRNTYWRELPRQLMALALKILCRHNPRLITPGGLESFMSDPDTWNAALQLDANDPTSPLRAECRRILEMQDYNPEHYTQHIQAALTALKIFSWTPLNDVGYAPDIDHEELLRSNYIVGFVSPIRLAERIGPYFALHSLSFLNAQLSGHVGRTCMVLDEFCAAPLKELVKKITVYRAFSLWVVYITQSRQDAIQKYGEKEIAVLEDNVSIIQYLKASNIEETERLSKAIGNEHTLQHSLGLNSDQRAFSGNVGLGRDRVIPQTELMTLRDDEQLVFVSRFGWMKEKKLRQNNMYPFCYALAPNPHEGGVLPPDPKVDFNTTPINTDEE